MKKTVAVAEAKLSYLDFFILSCILLVPLVWSKYLNANYFSAKFFLVYFISSISLLASSRKVVMPKLPRFLAISILALAFLHFVSPIVSQSWQHIYFMFKFLSFIFLAYYFYTLPFQAKIFFEKYDYILLAVSGLILTFALNDFYLNRVVKLDTQSGFLLGSFGNVNMMAEFLILSLPLIHIWLRKNTSIHSFLKSIIFLGWLFFIFYCRSRSAWIGLGLWTVWAAFNKQLGKKEIAMLILAFLLYHISFLAPFVDSVGAQVKQDSFSQRMHLYVSTLNLIKDHPIGVGVGQFITDIIPYLVNSDFRPMEYVYFDQPHSDFLKWAVQFGWLGFIFPIVILSYLLIASIKAKNFFLTSSFLVLLPQISFQFPFENPASLVYLAFVFALSLKNYELLKNFYVTFKNRLLIFLVALIGVAHAFAYVSSIFYETSHNGDIDLVLYSCDVYPININACFNRNHFLMSSNNYVQARFSMSETLGLFPFHAGLMRLLPIYLKNKVNDKASCEAVLEYNYIFVDQKFFTKEIIERCGMTTAPVLYKDPEQFKADYMKWQRQFFKAE